MKYLRVHIEGPYVGTDRTSYHKLEGDEDQATLDEIAEQEYNEYASYSAEVVDESEVPEDER